MNRWIILYDDGRTPKIHSMTVEAETAERALETPDACALTAKQIWCVVLEHHSGTAAAVLLRMSRAADDLGPSDQEEE